MATIDVVFADAWLTDVADPTVSIHASFEDRKQALSKKGEVRIYAGGRRRVITTAGRQRVFPLMLQLLSDAELVLLDSWLGRVLLLRDPAGRRVFGTFLAGDSEDFYDKDGTLHNVSLTFTEVDYTEGS